MSLTPRPKICTGATLNQETNEMDSCSLPAVWVAKETEARGEYHWRGDYCVEHAHSAGQAHPTWEFWTLNKVLL